MAGEHRTETLGSRSDDGPIGVVYAGYQSTYRVATADSFADRLSLLPIYDLPKYDLAEFAAIVVPSVVDQEFLAEEADSIVAYLESGGVLVSFAKVFRAWLEGYRWRSNAYSPRELELEIVRDHPVIAPLAARDLNWYEGVQGWFTRGYLETPAGGRPLVVDPDDRPVIAVDDETTAGTIFATAGADLFHLAFRDRDPYPAVADRLLEWAGRESDRRGSVQSADRGGER